MGGREIHQNVSLLTVVHTATLDAINPLGKLRVYWDLAESPNIRYPNTAVPPYNRVTIPKLQPN